MTRARPARGVLRPGRTAPGKLPGTCFKTACALLAGVLVSGCGTVQRAYVDPDAEFTRAVTLRSQGQHADAGDAFARFARRFEQDSRADFAQFLSGEEYAAAGNSDAAVDAFNTLFRRFPHSAYLSRANDMCVRLGTDMLASGNNKGAAFLERVIDRTPYGPTATAAHMELGKYYLESERPNDARLEFDSVAREQPNTPLGVQAEFLAAVSEYRLIGRHVRNMDHLVSARERLLKLRTASLDATDMETVDRYLGVIADLAAEHHMLMAQFYLKQGEIVPALAHLREIVDRYPGTRHHEPAADLILFIREEARKMEEADKGKRTEPQEGPATPAKAKVGEERK